MRHVVDGSNLLGALGLERESDGAKHQLVRMLAAFGRAKRCRIDCVFDGLRPDGFATSFGGLSVKFSHPRSGDDLVERLVAGDSAPCVVVTSDRALGAKLRSRRVKVESCAEFRSGLERAVQSGEQETPQAGDWEAYFSDPKNRNV